MATKARRLKSPIQLWVVDHRKAGGWTSQDLAEWTGVTVDTARGWESRGRPSQDALDILAVKFGSQPPTESPGGGDTLTPGLSDLLGLQQTLVGAFETQAQAVMSLVTEMRLAREAEAVDLRAQNAMLQVRLDTLEATIRSLLPEPGTPASSTQVAPRATTE